MIKFRQILVSLTLALVSSSSNFCVLAQSKPEVYNPDFMMSALSDNAVYAISSTMGDEDVDNPHSAGGKIINLKTKEAIDVPAPSGWAELNDVTDDGLVVGSAAGKPGYWTAESGVWTTFDVPKTRGGGSFLAVTPDGHYAVGYFLGLNDPFAAYPMIYDLTTGESIKVTNLPKVDMSGVDQKQNVFYDISPDGRYVLGQMSQSYLLPVALFSYIYDRETDTWTPIGFDYNVATSKFSPQHPYLYFIDNQYMSRDGKWVTGTAYLVRDGGETVGGTEGNYPYRYNIAEGKFEIYDSLSDESISGNKITADGTVLGCSPTGNPYPTAMIRGEKHFVSLDQILQQVYNTTPQRLIGDGVTGSFQSISADGKTALMCTYDNSYVISMHEDFKTLADQVNLLANYTLDIPAGSKINRISEIKITFERAIECMNYPQDIKLLDNTGSLVRNASGFTVSPTNDHTAVVTFRSTTLKAGESYTIEIPAGMVWLSDDASVKSNKISISYTGREEGPVKAVSVYPADGALVTEFNSSPDYLTLTFDTPIAISQTFSCNLYNDDDNTLITGFNATTSGNSAVFFPTAAYMLYKGSNYRIEISEGSITDLSGGGASEKIVLHYTGAYVRQLSDDDIYIFNADCDSYDNFIFWKAEAKQPSAIPSNWGFTEDNIWLLLRDDEQSEDWALAAHSMFSPPGESDDWLVTPQLYIPDANTYLAFDAQSYMRSKDDVLKVYIYSDDALYNYFSAELADVFRKDGDLVFDEVIPAGKTDDGLAGEWSHYTVDLEKYAGKNIYIAFVNNNYDKSAIFINDVKVIRNMDFLITNQTPSTVVDKTSVSVSGILSIASEISTFDGIALSLLDEDGDTISSIQDDSVSLAYGDTYNFAFADPLTLTPGTETKYKIVVTANGNNAVYSYSVKDLYFAPVKKIVLEEYTGSTCGNCPLGIQAIDYLCTLYPDNFIPVTLRTYMNDMYATGIVDYTTYLGLNAAPTGRINRGPVLSPMLQNGPNGYEFFGKGIIMSDGNEAYLWADAVQDLLNVPAEAEVDFQVAYKESSRELSIPCTVKFALDSKERSVGLFAVVIEDKLPAFQLNYFNTVSDPALGEWGAGGIYGQSTVTTWLANDVARFVVTENAYSGNTMPETDFEAGTSYSMTLDAQIPDGRLTNAANCKVVVMLIDKATGEIINANVAAFGTSGITDIESEDTAAEYYNLQGLKVANPEHGQIYIRVSSNGSQKVLFR